MPKRCTERPSSLNSDGYFVIKQAIRVDSNVIYKLRGQVEKRGRVIFGHDRKRLQCKVRHGSKPLQAFIGALSMLVIKDHMPTYNVNPSEWVIVRSLPGGQPQPAHCDYDPKIIENEPNERKPFAALVAVEPDTKLTVWKGCFGKITNQVQPEDVTLDPGDMLIFRGDLVHAGSAYDQDNIRLHCYFDIFKIPRTKDRTYLIE